jgi:hypothetical protein
VLAQSQGTRVLINSADWKDVYSGMLYANLNNYQGYFLTSTRHGTIILYSIPKGPDPVEIISSRTNPYVLNYKSILENGGYNNVEELKVGNGNLELLELLPNINKFIIIDPSYGYNSISVAPYALLGKYYVLFADQRNINQVVRTMDDRSPTEVIIYGQVARQVKNALEKYNPTTINTGDRFDNNIEIVKLYQKLYTKLNGQPRRQAILTNGEFIEDSVVAGKDPVLFIGYSNVPEQVREYIKNSELQVGTLVGNELIGTATFVRRQTGLSVFVKFGQGARVPQGVVAQVEDLDRFPIPTYPLSLEIITASINTATNNLEITYHNPGRIGAYFHPLLLTITDEEKSAVIPDESPSEYIEANSYKTTIHPLVDADANKIELVGDNLTLEVNTIYGESPKSLEQTLQKIVNVERVSIFDEAEIDIIDVSYAKSGSKFLVKVKNVGTVDAYVTAEIHDLDVNGELLIVGADGILLLPVGKTITIPIQTTMTELDVPQNPQVKVKVIYGERENALIKVKEGLYDFKYAAFDFTIIIIVILIILLLLLIFLKKKCKKCDYKNPIVRKYCRKCGEKL